MPTYDDRKIHRAMTAMGQEPSFPLPKVPRRRDNSESRSQQSLITWWHHACASFGVSECLFFAVGNGGKRSAITGAIMKREGVRAGTSDLLLLAKRGIYGALAIELKKDGGRLTPEQTLFLIEATKAGYYAVACYSTEQAVNVITHYLTKPEALF